MPQGGSEEVRKKVASEGISVSPALEFLFRDVKESDFDNLLKLKGSDKKDRKSYFQQLKKHRASCNTSRSEGSPYGSPYTRVIGGEAASSLARSFSSSPIDLLSSSSEEGNGSIQDLSASSPLPSSPLLPASAPHPQGAVLLFASYPSVVSWNLPLHRLIAYNPLEGPQHPILLPPGKEQVQLGESSDVRSDGAAAQPKASEQGEHGKVAEGAQLKKAVEALDFSALRNLPSVVTWCSQERAAGKESQKRLRMDHQQLLAEILAAIESFQQKKRLPRPNSASGLLERLRNGKLKGREAIQWYSKRPAAIVKALRCQRAQSAIILQARVRRLLSSQQSV